MDILNALLLYVIKVNKSKTNYSYQTKTSTVYLELKLLSVTFTYSTLFHIMNLYMYISYTMHFFLFVFNDCSVVR